MIFIKHNIIPKFVLPKDKDKAQGRWQAAESRNHRPGVTGLKELVRLNFNASRGVVINADVELL